MRETSDTVRGLRIAECAWDETLQQELLHYLLCEPWVMPTRRDERQTERQQYEEDHPHRDKATVFFSGRVDA